MIERNEEMKNEEPIRVNHEKLEDKQAINDFYEGLLQKNKEIYLLGGELNPLFYRSLIDKYSHVLGDKSINIICGPYISVEDALFLEYFDTQDNSLDNWWYAKPRDNWWNAHPIFAKVCSNDNIKAYVVKKRHDPHFAVGCDSHDVFLEDRHDELEERGAKLCFGDKKLAEEYLDLWRRTRDTECCEWDKGSQARLFKPISVIKEENTLEENLKEEFKDIALLSV